MLGRRQRATSATRVRERMRERESRAKRRDRGPIVYACARVKQPEIETANERALLAGQLARTMADWGAGELPLLHGLLEQRLAELPEADYQGLLERIRNTGASWGYHPPDPFARQLSREIMAMVLTEGSGLDHGEGLAACRKHPVVLVANHLSYVDVNVFDALCAEHGYADIVDRLATVVGPKVYVQPIRRLASLCFATIKTPQSSSLASEEAVMSPRDVARIVRTTLEVARERVRVGDHLMIFPEGYRSRTATLQRFLPAIARYLAIPGAYVLPWAHVGSERLVPLNEDHVYPCAVRVRVGSALSLDRLLARCEDNRALTMDAIGFAVADLLPERYRGVYSSARDGLEEARAVADELAAEPG
jgi:1-acyl-sn-glycerol-3-phosphate acyltransferase